MAKNANAVNTSGVQSTTPKWVVPVALALFCLLIGWQRWYTRREPMERNYPTYAVIGHEVLHGRALYSDVFDQKPPAIHATYAAGELAFGYGRPAIIFIGLGAAWLTLGGVYAAGRTLSGKPVHGLLAAGIYALVASDLGTEANYPNAESFMMVCFAWGFAVLVASGTTLISRRSAVGIGVLFALATLYKTIGATIPILLIAACVAFPPGGAAHRRGAIERGVIVLGMIALAWGLLFGWFGATGRLDAFYYAMVTYNRAYSGNTGLNALRSFGQHALPVSPISFLLPNALLIIVGLVFNGWRNASGRRWEQGIDVRWLWLLAWCIGTCLAVGLPGKFIIYYYQLWFPILAVGSAWAVYEIGQAESLSVRRFAAYAAVAAVIVPLLREAQNYTRSPEEWSRLTVRDEFIQSERVGKRINALLLPDETFYDAANNPELYFISRRPPLSGILYSEATTTGARAEAFEQRLLADLNRHPPDLIVEEMPYDVSFETNRWIQERYVLLPSLPDAPRYALFARRGSRLAARPAKN